MPDDLTTFLILLVFLGVFSFFFIDWVGLGTSAVDYQNIWNCIKDGGWSNGVNTCDFYPPLWIFLGRFFSAQELFYKQFVMIVFALFTPLVLYWITKKPIIVWFYFSATNYFYAVTTSAFFAQGLAMSIILSMIFIKNIWLRLLILTLLIVAHSTSFYLGIFFLALLLLEESNFTGIPGKLKGFLVCSPFWNQTPPVMINTTVVKTNSVFGAFTLNTIGSILLKRTPLPFLYFSVKSLIAEKKLALLGLLVVSFLVGVFYHERSFYFMSFPMLIGLTLFYSQTSRPMQKAILVLTVVNFIFNIEQFILLKINCPN